MTNGLIQLTEGSEELSTQLNEAARKSSGIHTDSPTTSMFAKPV
ncbi:hypothetical protein ACJROX_13845 [Pseudalkalibacillus sp. A8]